MEQNGKIYCDALFCNLRIVPHEPQVLTGGKNYHSACWQKIRPKQKEATMEIIKKEVIFIDGAFRKERYWVKGWHINLDPYELTRNKDEIVHFYIRCIWGFTGKETEVTLNIIKPLFVLGS